MDRVSFLNPKEALSQLSQEQLNEIWERLRIVVGEQCERAKVLVEGALKENIDKN